MVSNERLADWTLALCEVPSETGDEAAIADWVERELGALRPDWAIARHGESVVAHPPIAAGKPTIGCFGHLDTVKPASKQTLAIQDGRVFGCGASDMKAGLAVMLGLAEAWKPDWEANLVLVFYDKEEGPARENGLEPLLNAQGAVPPLDLAVCLEPTDNRVQLGCVGGLHAQVTFEGQRAHSARPWQGRNAIYPAADLLSRLAARERVPVRFGELTFYEVITATTAQTANSRNVVPDRFMLNLNYRFAPGKSLAQARQELTAFVGPGPGVLIVDEAPAGEVISGHPRFADWLEATGLPLEPKQAWTDVARLSARGVPAFNFGPGETAQAHQADESVPVAALGENLAALTKLFAPS